MKQAGIRSRAASKPRRGAPVASIAATAALLLLLPLILFVARDEHNRSLSPNRVTADYVAAVIGSTQDTDKLMAAARDLALRRPYEPAPFFIAAAVSGTLKQDQRATMFLRKLIERRVSYAPAHLFLAGHYFRTGQTNLAVNEADMAMRVQTGYRALLIPMLVAQLNSATGLAALSAALDRAPTWRDEFINAAIADNVPPESLFAILGRTPPGANAGILAEQRANFVNALLARGDAERGYLAWISFVPSNLLGRIRPVNDGNFMGMAAPGPFNWTFPPADGAYAEPGTAGAEHFLDASYSSTISLLLATQTLFLQPGEWTLSMSVRGAREETAGKLIWRLQCQPGDQEIGAIDLADVTSDWTQRQLTVKIPTGCATQKLLLLGLPGETTQPATAQIRGVRMVRAQ